MNPEIHLNKPSSEDGFQDSYAVQAPILSVKEWLVTFIIGAIPVVNLVMLFVWAFGGNANPNKMNYSKAALLLAAIFIVLYIIVLVVIFVIFGASISNGLFDNFN
jgi:hypothetical protein